MFWIGIPSRRRCHERTQFLGDPAGVAAVDLTNPQTWNRYVYVSNDPCAELDPLGLATCRLKVQLINDVGLTSGQVNSTEKVIQQVFGQTTDPDGNSVGIDFTDKNPDATLSITNASSVMNFILSIGGLEDVPFGCEGGMCGAPSVYWNNLAGYLGGTSNLGVLLTAVGHVGSHELGHELGLGEERYDSKNPNIMEFDYAPEANQLAAISLENQSKLWHFDAVQMKELFENCKTRRNHGMSGDYGYEPDGVTFMSWSVWEGSEYVGESDGIWVFLPGTEHPPKKK